MNRYQNIAALLLRLALSFSFLSAVASRLGFWGKRSSGWHNFLDYTAQVNSFLPKNIIPAIAIASTIAETTLGIMLLVGFKTNYAAGGAAILTLLFAVAMSLSFGVKEHSIILCSLLAPRHFCRQRCQIIPGALMHY